MVEGLSALGIEAAGDLIRALAALDDKSYFGAIGGMIMRGTAAPST